uniref:Epidermal patterning factor-like protein n=1 Tax=Picea sitchensis TaxID=3332 RepID=D5A7W3_PICSI|nr:unknown [Picea sitchensis]
MMMHNISCSCKCTELLLLLIWIFSAAVAASRSNFVPDYRHDASPMGTMDKVSLQAPTSGASDQMMVMVKVAQNNNIARHVTTIDTLGSRPPTCRNKCSSCSPCEAIQVPTNAARSHVQYSNYEPEGWKCKCRDRVFNP